MCDNILIQVTIRYIHSNLIQIQGKGVFNMPAAHVHYRFGKEVLDCLPFVYRKTIEKYRELYDIGLHGPDILFYNKPLSSNEINRTGYSMHDRPAAEFFEKTAALYGSFQNKEALKSYLYGFICHFTLDSTCHPYIEKMTHESHISHAELETELERYFMELDGLNPAEHIPTGHIHATDENASVIAPCFSPITADEIKASLKGMIRCHQLLHAPKEGKRKFLYFALKLAGKYDSMQGLIMKPEANEACRRYCVLLNNMYTEAITIASSLIQQYANVLDHDAALSSRFLLTFGAGESWEELYI